jgi:hypothetical protein
MRPTALVAIAAPLLFAAGRAVPKFDADPCWPKPLPNNWMLGQVSGIFVDAHGPGYAWPDNEHGMFFDYKENVSIGGNGAEDTNILKFSKTGKFLLQIGHHGNSGGSNDTENLNRPAGIVVYAKINEVVVADGGGNRRVIVFDAATGAYKRHWGAYGNMPSDSVPRSRTYEGPGRNSSIPSMAFASPTTNWCMWATA